MAILYLDGFDHGDTAEATRRGWTIGAGGGMVTGRYGTGYAINTGNAGGLTIAEQNVLSCGFSGYATPHSVFEEQYQLFRIGYNSNVHVRIIAAHTYSYLTINLAGANYIVSLPFPLYNGQFVHYQIYWVGSTSGTGTFRLWVNSRLMLDLSNVTTAVGNGNANWIGGNRGIWDDLWVATGELLGDIRVHHLLPTSTVSGGWSVYPSTSTNHDAVDELNPNDDTDYVYTSTAGAVDVYEFGDLPTTATAVRAIGLLVLARKDDPGSRTFRPFIQIGASRYGNNFAVPDSYTYFAQYWQQNPDTSADWTVADVNNLQAGVELIS